MKDYCDYCGSTYSLPKKHLLCRLGFHKWKTVSECNPIYLTPDGKANGCSSIAEAFDKLVPFNVYDECARCKQPRPSPQGVRP